MLWNFLAKVCAGALISTLRTALLLCSVGWYRGLSKATRSFWADRPPRTPLRLKNESISLSRPQINDVSTAATTASSYAPVTSISRNIWIEISGPLPFWFMTQVNTWVFNREWDCRLLIAEALGKGWLYFLEMLHEFYTLLVIRNALWIWKDTKLHFKISLVVLPRENIKLTSWIESCWNLTMNLLSFQCSLVVYTRLIRASRFEEIMKEKFHLPSAFGSKN